MLHCVTHIEGLARGIKDEVERGTKDDKDNQVDDEPHEDDTEALVPSQVGQPLFTPLLR